MVFGAAGFCVHTAVGTILNVMLQLVIVPISPPASSTTNSSQLPLGLPVLVKELIRGVACVREPGPGAGKLSVAPILVGLQVPETITAGKTVAAASLKV